MAEAAPLAVGIDTLAGGTVSAAVRDVVRSVTDLRALSSRQALESAPGLWRQGLHSSTDRD